jgi:hypothetical protein
VEFVAGFSAPAAAVARPKSKAMHVLWKVKIGTGGGESGLEKENEASRVTTCQRGTFIETII